MAVSLIYREPLKELASKIQNKMLNNILEIRTNQMLLNRETMHQYKTALTLVNT